MISVIIPVYNDATLLPRAIRSCLSQIEVSEVIVINDGSIDDINQAISQFNDLRLIILSHPDGQNHGRSASRNLGIEQSTAEWIAFCDADDYFLPERFAHLSLKSEHRADGYYDTIKRECAHPALSKLYPETQTALSKHVTPDDLGNYLISNREERISILGLIIRKAALIDIDLFDTELSTGEDTDLIWRLSLHYQLQLGHNTNQPVAVRWIDGNNTHLNKKQVDIDRYHFYKKWKHQISNYNLSTDAVKRIEDSWRYYKRRRWLRWFG